MRWLMGLAMMVTPMPMAAAVRVRARVSGSGGVGRDVIDPYGIGQFGRSTGQSATSDQLSTHQRHQS